MTSASPFATKTPSPHTKRPTSLPGIQAPEKNGYDGNQILPMVVTWV